MVLLILATLQIAQADLFNVVTRKANGKVDIAAVELPLTQPDYFETKNFMIVFKRENTPIAIKAASDEMRLKAATVLYNLEKAYAYFDQLKAPQIKKMGQIKVRLDITDSWDDLYHYKDERKKRIDKTIVPAPIYNSGATANNGKYEDALGKDEWGKEIWFRPKKEIPISEILNQMPENPLNPQIRKTKDVLYPMQFDIAYRNSISELVNPETTSLKNMSLRQGSGLLMIESAFQLLKVINRILIPKHFYIDAALVPEIIFHEYTHAAVSDYLEPYVNNPVNEGIADYFAASISNNPKLAKKIKKYSTATGKNGKKPKEFELSFEEKADGDYVLSVLWGLRKFYGAQKTDELILKSREFMNIRNVTILDGMVDALYLACKQVCKDPNYDSLILLQYFNDPVHYRLKFRKN